MPQKSHVINFEKARRRHICDVKPVSRSNKRLSAFVDWLKKISQSAGRSFFRCLLFFVSLPISLALSLLYWIAPLGMFIGAAYGLVGYYELHQHTARAAHLADLKMVIFGTIVFVTFGFVRHFAHSLCRDPNEQVVRLSAWDRFLLVTRR
jgi:hypothetical protein